MTFDGFNFFSKNNFVTFNRLPLEVLSRDKINKLYDEEKQACWNNKSGIQEKIVQLIKDFKQDKYPDDDWKQQDVWERISFEDDFKQWFDLQPDYSDIDVEEMEDHLKRTFTANLEYPIALVTVSGGVDRVLDGNHRLLQALVRGVNSVKVVKVINPDFVLNEWERINFNSVQ